ncbi:type VII secretion integral membrane protein EccD [Aestuariimicrobium soli]|uniref:type VII secretion integral membrane protein EccD n=1 Tax=Aestuariimicrobium soli TaxID=2035834 RepID=UPI003EBA6D9F
MSTSTDEDIARVTVISPNRRVDLALPGQVTLGEVLPGIVRFAGLEANSVSDAVHSWVLQRFGEDPLDSNQVISQLGLSDGETLHLRQRENALPDAAFDDVVDAVATSTDRRPSWEPKHSQRLALAVMISLLVGLPTLMMFQPMRAQNLNQIARMLLPSGPAALYAAIASGVLAFACTIAAVSVSRAAGEYRVSSAFAWTAVALAAFAGYGALSGSAAVPLRITVAAAAVLVVAAANAMAAGVQVMGLFTAAVTAALLLVASTVMVVQPTWVLSVAAVTIAVMVGVTSMLPTWSYRIARIALPAVPPDAQAMMADETPVQSDIVSRALLADRLIASFLVATCTIAAVFSVPLVLSGNWWALGFTAAVGLALALRGRAFVGLQQRLALLLSGTFLLMGAFGLTLVKLPPVWQGLLSGVVLLFAVLLLAIFATSMYNTIVAPTWGRAGDILEWVSMLAMVPLLLGVLDLYTRVRALGG